MSYFGIFLSRGVFGVICFRRSRICFWFSGFSYEVITSSFVKISFFRLEALAWRCWLNYVILLNWSWYLRWGWCRIRRSSRMGDRASLCPLVLVGLIIREIDRWKSRGSRSAVTFCVIFERKSIHTCSAICSISLREDITEKLIIFMN